MKSVQGHRRLGGQPKQEVSTEDSGVSSAIVPKASARQKAV